MSQLTSRNVSQKLPHTCGICHRRGNRELAVGAACPQLWGRVDGAPITSARIEKLLQFSVYVFSFVFIGEKAKGKISGLKPVRKLDLGVHELSLL